MGPLWFLKHYAPKFNQRIGTWPPFRVEEQLPQGTIFQSIFGGRYIVPELGGSVVLPHSVCGAGVCWMARGAAARREGCSGVQDQGRGFGESWTLLCTKTPLPCARVGLTTQPERLLWLSLPWLCSSGC